LSSNIIVKAIVYGSGHGKLPATILVTVSSRRTINQTGHHLPKPVSTLRHARPPYLPPHAFAMLPMPMMDATKPNVVEAAIYITSQGEQAGRYIASCAKEECGYFGQYHSS